MYISTGQGVLAHNMFLYCNNNSIVYRDRKGYFSEAVLVVISVTVASIVLKIIDNVIHHEKWYNEFILASLLGLGAGLIGGATVLGLQPIIAIGLSSVLSVGTDLRFNYSKDEDYLDNLGEELFINSVTSLIPSLGGARVIIKETFSYISGAVAGGAISYSLSQPSSNKIHKPVDELNKQKNLPQFPKYEKKVNPCLSGSVLASLVIK